MPTTGPESRAIVAVGIATDSAGRLLVGQRPPGKDYAGQWEFPGGKLEPGETVYQALVREFGEELNLTVLAARPLFSSRQTYPDRSVELHLWHVTRYHGEMRGLEGQVLRWVSVGDLDSLDFLEGNRSLLKRVCALTISDCQ